MNGYFYSSAATADELASDMAAYIQNNQSTLFAFAVDLYESTVSTIGTKVNAILGLANQVYEKADEARDNAQGDEFRLKGIDADIAFLQAGLSAMVDTLLALRWQLEAVIAAAMAAGPLFTQYGEGLETSWYNIDGMIMELQA